MLLSLLTLLASATLSVNASPISRRQAVTCVSGVYILHARGSTESEADDATLPVVNRILDAIPNSSEQDVEYPATIIADDSFYSTSVADGIDDIISKIKNYVDTCGSSSRIVLVGYSQGGNVISSALAGGIVHPIPLSLSYKKNSESRLVQCDLTFYEQH